MIIFDEQAYIKSIKFSRHKFCISVNGGHSQVTVWWDDADFGVGMIDTVNKQGGI